ncbi:MAG: DUF302 domain-containing protein [Opitutaceae bacterium]|nr:DUF302 domain-containing protein [Opitutaceae bacterium]
MNSSLLLGLFLGGVLMLVIVGVVAVLAVPRLMLHERPSPLGLDATVEKITRAALDAGWVVQSVVELEKSVKKNGGGDVRPVRLVNLCEARHAAEILRDDSARKVSVLMPCTISVYEKADGRAYVGTLNAGLMARLFGGVVARIMGGPVAADQARFTAFTNPPR